MKTQKHDQHGHRTTLRSRSGNNMPMNRKEEGEWIRIQNPRNENESLSNRKRSRWERDQVMAGDRTINDHQDPCSAGKLKARYGWIAQGRTGYAYGRGRWMSPWGNRVPYPRMRGYTRVGVRDEGSGMSITALQGCYPGRLRLSMQDLMIVVVVRLLIVSASPRPL